MTAASCLGEATQRALKGSYSAVSAEKDVVLFQGRTLSGQLQREWGRPLGNLVAAGET